MHATDHSAQMRREKVSERLQRRRSGLPNLVAISDEQRVGFREWQPLPLVWIASITAPMPAHEFQQLRINSGGQRLSVKKLQVRLNLRHHPTLPRSRKIWRPAKLPSVDESQFVSLQEHLCEFLPRTQPIFCLQRFRAAELFLGIPRYYFRGSACRRGMAHLNVRRPSEAVAARIGPALDDKINRLAALNEQLW